jgi:hypothetical protein
MVTNKMVQERAIAALRAVMASQPRMELGRNAEPDPFPDFSSRIDSVLNPCFIRG